MARETKATSTSHRNKLQRQQSDLLKQQTELAAFEEKLKHAADQKIDDLYEAAISGFVERHKAGEEGRPRSAGGMPRSAVKLTIEISEELFQEAEKVAKRLGMKRDVLYAVALAKHVSFDANAGADDNHGTGDGRAHRAARSRGSLGLPLERRRAPRLRPARLSRPPPDGVRVGELRAGRREPPEARRARCGRRPEHRRDVVHVVGLRR